MVFQDAFRAISTKFFSLLRGLVTVSYRVVSTPLLSAPGGPVALPASATHNVAVSVRIMPSQSCRMVWMRLAKVVWSGTGSPAHGILITDGSLSISRAALCHATIRMQGKSSLTLKRAGGRPLFSSSWYGHGFSRTRLVIMSIRNAVSMQCPRW